MDIPERERRNTSKEKKKRNKKHPYKKGGRNRCSEEKNLFNQQS